MVPYLTPVPIRKKAPPFQEVEMRRLIAMYSASYSKYHAKLQPGMKWASSDKNRLLEKWSQYLSCMGVAPRTKAQIEEKLRNEVKRIHRFLRAESARCERYPLPSYLDPLVRILARNRQVDGTPEKEDINNVVEEFVKEEMNSSDEEYSDSQLFESGRKPTFYDLPPSQSSGSWKISEKGISRQRGKQHDHDPETTSTSSEAKHNLSTTSLAREVLSYFSDGLVQLLDEEAKLARIRQEEASMAVEVRKLEIEKLNLEIEWLKRRTDSETSNGTCS
uniref:Alcohol dehydrogenase transcription factor myb/sant-like protein n=1 Tax=Haemonchus contortus TaxID=6289 RepID=A0A7I4YED6_HAECO